MGVVLLKPSPSLLLLRDAFHCLASGVHHLQRDGYQVSTALLAAYSGVSVAYANELRERILALPDSADFWPNVIDHLLERLRQARQEEVLLEPLEVLEQLAGRLHAAETLVL